VRWCRALQGQGACDTVNRQSLIFHTSAGADPWFIFMAAATPDYAKWCDRKSWTLHEAICLALAIEPGTVRRETGSGIGGFGPVELAIEQYGEPAEDAMRSGALKPLTRAELSRPALQRRVEPRAFLQFAKTWKMPIPGELETLLAREPARPPVVVSTVLEHLGHGYRGADYIEEAREQVLGAALAVLKSFPERCTDAIGIRRAIDDNASLLWPEKGRPPLTSMEMERLISRWLERLG
jgi:hypothetical protein